MRTRNIPFIVVCTLIVLLTGCATAKVETAAEVNTKAPEQLTVLPPVEETVAKETIIGPESIIAFNSYGDAYTNIKLEDALKEGIELTDILTVTINGYTFDASVVSRFGDVDQGKGAVIIAENGEISVGLADANLKETANLSLGDKVTYRVKSKKGYSFGYLTHHRDANALRANASTDSQFTNFRQVAMGSIAKGKLYRSAAPIINDERSSIINVLAERAGIESVIGLKEGSIANIPASGISYFVSLAQNGKVNMVNMDSSFGPEFIPALKSALLAIINSKGPYLITDINGMDRTGAVCAVIEALCGASFSEIADDYMQSYTNFYGFEKGSDAYNQILASAQPLVNIFTNGKPITERTRPMSAAISFLRNTVGLTTDEIASLRLALRK